MADICCSQPLNDPNYTVCFPENQLIPNNPILQSNPYYDFTNKVSYWTYTIQIDAGSTGDITSLSHWLFQICPTFAALAKDNPPASNYFVAEVSEDGGPFINISDTLTAQTNPPPNPEQPPVANALLINRGQPTGTTYTYRITITDPNYFDLAAQPGLVAIKHGENPPPNKYKIFDCGLLTPSINCDHVTPPQPVLTLTKSCPQVPARGYFTVGDSPVITLTVTNTGQAAATNVVVKDLINIPAGVTVDTITLSPAGTVTPAPPVTNANVNVEWTIPTISNIPPNNTVTLTATLHISDVTPNAIRVITNANAGIETLPEPPQYTCTIPVENPQPVLSLTKSCPQVPARGFFIPGETATITITINNTGEAAATNQTILDRINIPAGVTIGNLVISDGGTVTFPGPGPIYTNTNIDIQWTGITIPANGSKTLTVSFLILAAPQSIAIITNVNAGIGQLSVPPKTCNFPVRFLPPPPPGRGIDYKHFKL